MGPIPDPGRSHNAAGQLSRWATAAEPALQPESHEPWTHVPQLPKSTYPRARSPHTQEPALRNKRSHRSEKPCAATGESAPLSAARESPHGSEDTAQPERINKIIFKFKILDASILNVCHLSLVPTYSHPMIWPSSKSNSLISFIAFLALSKCSRNWHFANY